LNELSEFIGSSEVRRPSMNLSVKPQDGTSVSATEPRGVVDKRPEHGLEIERGTADDLENFTRRGLLLKRFGELLVPLLEFLE
jgi:hypothetical protein